MIKLKAPENSTSLSYQGETYVVENGVVEVPAQAVTDLVGGHGFVLADTEESAAASGELGGAGNEATEANTNTAATAATGVTPPWASAVK